MYCNHAHFCADVHVVGAGLLFFVIFLCNMYIFFNIFFFTHNLIVITQEAKSRVEMTSLLPMDSYKLDQAQIVLNPLILSHSSHGMTAVNLKVKKKIVSSGFIH